MPIVIKKSMFKLKSATLAVVMSSFAIIGSAGAVGVEDYLAGIESISHDDLMSYLTKYDLGGEAQEEPQKSKTVEPKGKSSSVVPKRLGQSPSKVVVAKDLPHKSNADDVENMKRSIGSNDSSAIGSLYLRNIPEASVIHFNDNLLLLPNEKHAFFHNGQRVYSKPEFSEQGVTQFCMFSLSETGKARRVSKFRELFITKISEFNTTYRNDIRDTETLVRATKIMINNPDLREVVCISAGSPRPLAIKDLIESTGGLVGIKTQDYTEI